MFRRSSLWLVVFVVMATSVACSSSNPQPQAEPPTATAGSQPVPPPVATSTLPPVATTHAPAPTEIAPTIEPPPLIETPTPTATPTRTPRPRLTVSTVRPRQTAAPLNVSYEVVAIKRGPGDQASLALKVIATGGSGSYRYYHDDIQQPGATFIIAGTCGKPFVHTIKVTSGDGQSVALPYHVNGVCPTPTP
jgi:hypothetical protein